MPSATADQSAGGGPQPQAAISLPAFIPGLEMSRGVAALMVALLHSGQATYYDAVTGKTQILVGATVKEGEGRVLGTILRMVGNGHGAVIFFFVLSGFVLTLMLQRQSYHPARSALVFLSSRLLRIMPAVFATTLLFGAVFVTTGRSLAEAVAYQPGIFLRNMVLLRTDIDGVMWSLQLELLAAPMIFVLFWSWTRLGPLPVIAALIALLACSFAPTWRHWFGPLPELTGSYSFVAGMLTCFYGRAFIARLPRPRIVLPAAMLGFALSRPLLHWWSPWAIVFETVFASIIVATIAYGMPLLRPRGKLSAVLQYYGRISFSFYLLHALTLVVIWRLQGPLGALVASHVPQAVLGIALFIVTTIAITPVAHLQWRFVERPAMRLGRWLGRKTDTVAAVRAPQAPADLQAKAAG